MSTDAFFAPLKNLKPRGARVYLGVIHHMDGFKERIALARKYLPEFGLAAYCGFGRVPPAEFRPCSTNTCKPSRPPVSPFNRPCTHKSAKSAYSRSDLKAGIV